MLVGDFRKLVTVVLGALLLMGMQIPVMASIKATVVHLDVTDVGSQQYRSRLIVTPEYLRFDDGNDGGDFLLYDRKKKTIYNTSAQDQTILVIRNQKVKLPEQKDWKHNVDSDNQKLPDVGGKAVKHWVLLTNNLVCYDLYSAQGLLPDVTAALAEYRRVLATQQAEIYVNSLDRKRDVCDLANNIYLPDRYLKHGFPIRYRDKDGRGEELAGYKKSVDVKPELFKLPAGYKEYSISDLR